MGSDLLFSAPDDWVEPSLPVVDPFEPMPVSGNAVPETSQYALDIGLLEGAPPLVDLYEDSVWTPDDVLPIQRQAEIGTNVTSYGAQGPVDPVLFINQLKGAWPWRAYGVIEDVTDGFDDNGYVTGIADGASVHSDILRRSAAVDGIAPFTGTFRLMGQGEGELSVGITHSISEVGRVHTSTLPTMEIDGKSYWYVEFDYSAQLDDRGRMPIARMFLYDVTEGDHIRDLALVHESHLEAFVAGEVFAPELIDDLTPYSTLRFMDLQKTNLVTLDADKRAADPEQRYIATDAYTYNTHASGDDAANVFFSSTPIEHLVELANRTNSNPWFNLSVDITDARALALAQYVRDHLDPGLTPVWEYGNEIWNSANGFRSYQYAARMGADTFDAYDTPSYGAAAEWAAYRGPQLYEMIDALYADTGIDPRYVAGMAGWNEPVSKNGSFNQTTWSAIYFNAVAAQSMPDAPPRPQDIVTDYAVGMYFGDMNEALMNYLGTAYDTPEDGAAALVRIQLFGNDPDTLVDVTRDALDAPLQDVVYHEGINIALSKLLYNDLRETGKDGLADLGDFVRLSGATLEYRGMYADDWTPVLQFTDIPPKSLDDMIADVEMLGHGHRSFGEIKIGRYASVLNAAENRLDGHLAFVEQLGLNFTAYEGGININIKSPEAAAVAAAYETQGHVAVVLNAWLDRMDAADVDLYMQYKSHDRFANGRDSWGSQTYVGQDLTEANRAALLTQTAALGQAEGDTPIIVRPLVTPTDPDIPTDPDAPTDPDVPEVDWDYTDELVFTDTNWKAADHWSFGPDNTATETSGSNEKITTILPLNVTAGGEYRLSFTLSDAPETDGGLIRVWAQAYGGGASYVGKLEADVVADRTYTLDLDTIPEPHDKLRLIIGRVAPHSSDPITISDFTLVDLNAPDSADQDTSGEESRVIDAWTHGTDWVSDGDDGLSEVTGGNTVIKTASALPVVPGENYTVSFLIKDADDRAGRIRVTVQAFGQGAEYVGYLDVTAVAGERIVLDLDTIEAPRDRVEITIRRAAAPAGSTITLSDFQFMPTDQVDDALAPDVPAGNPVQPGIVPEITSWQHEGNWTVSDGRLTETDGSNARIVASLPAPELRDRPYQLNFDVAEVFGDPGQIRVMVRAFGQGVSDIGFWQGSVQAGDRFSLDLDRIPDARHSLQVIVRRIGATAGSSLTLENFAFEVGDPGLLLPQLQAA